MTKKTNTAADKFAAKVIEAGNLVIKEMGVLDAGVLDFDAKELGTLAVAHSGEGQASLAYMLRHQGGDRPENWMSPSMEGSLNSKDDWLTKRHMAKLICLSPDEMEWLDQTKGSSDDTDKVKRKVLSDRVTEKLKTIKRGMVTADKKQNPDKYIRVGGGTRHIDDYITETIGDVIDKIQKDETNDIKWDRAEVIARCRDVLNAI